MLFIISLIVSIGKLHLYFTEWLASSLISFSVISLISVKSLNFNGNSNSLINLINLILNFSIELTLNIYLPKLIVLSLNHSSLLLLYFIYVGVINANTAPCVTSHSAEIEYSIPWTFQSPVELNEVVEFKDIDEVHIRLDLASKS